MQHKQQQEEERLNFQRFGGRKNGKYKKQKIAKKRKNGSILEF